MIYYVYEQEEPTEGYAVQVNAESKINDLLAAIQDNQGGHLNSGFSTRADTNGFIEFDWCDCGTHLTFICIPLRKPVDGTKMSYEPADDYEEPFDDPGVMDQGMHEKRPLV